MRVELRYGDPGKVAVFLGVELRLLANGGGAMIEHANRLSHLPAPGKRAEHLDMIDGAEADRESGLLLRLALRRAGERFPGLNVAARKVPDTGVRCLKGAA
jgi:hypothetical protein